MIEAWNAMILEFLSTPSARRATLEKLKNSPVYIISIHALREEGDEGLENDLAALEISIHALREEGDPEGAVLCHQPQRISIHALREEGDVQGAQHTIRGNKFLSTPSARRATARHQRRPGAAHISIHALREEGDQLD